jgi:hypothetical protein
MQAPRHRVPSKAKAIAIARRDTLLPFFLAFFGLTACLSVLLLKI